MKLLLIAAAALAVGGPAFAQSPSEPGKAPGATAAPAAGPGGQGVVKKLDAKAGSVTLQHGPIAALSWPAMTMEFKADPSLLNGLKVGQQVAFTVKPDAPAPELAAIQPK